MYQRTLKSKVTIHGHGVHSNKKTRLTVEPAPSGHGITFVRTDLEPAVIIPAKAEFISNSILNTTLGVEGYSIGTVEHIMAAFAGLGIDNAVVKVDGSEIPILDGSSYPFVLAFERAGFRTQRATRKYIHIDKPIRVERGESFAVLSPSPVLTIDCEIDFTHPVIGEQKLELIIDPNAFKAEISAARTFGFLHEAEILKARGLGLGADLGNCVVLDEKGVLNNEGLRYTDEFVRHKILDALGDLSLIGLPVLGKMSTFRGGHALHSDLLVQMINRNDAWHVAEADERLSEGRVAQQLRKLRDIAAYGDLGDLAASV